jgi:hypothetical protein
MLIGVFELLADAREQVAGVIAAIEAQRSFWLADAVLASHLFGRPLPDGSTETSINPGAAPTAATAH